MPLSTGIYEEVINSAIQASLSQLDKERFSLEIEKIDSAESSLLFSKYMAEVIQKGLLIMKETNGEERSLESQIYACNEIIDQISNIINDDQFINFKIEEDAKLLMAIWDKSKASLKARPETSIAVSTLFTGNKLEPQIVNELKKEILSADNIDFLVSFIKWSGLRLIIEELREHCLTKSLRIITTTYTGATDLKAIIELAKLPNVKIKISYDVRSERLHAKSYIFHRNSGYSTVYVGSSNLSSSAITGGLEWNIKFTQKDLPRVLDNVNASFETYWNDPKFETFKVEDEEKLRKALKDERSGKEGDDQYLFDIQPYDYQREILDELLAERTLHNRYRNLIVAATGTGKTVVSAFDYKRYRESNLGKPNRFLYVAHRREILEQSMKKFRAILRDNNFGELFDGLNHPSRLDHIFISIQTFKSQKLINMVDPEYYDYIIVDETHHGAAPSYSDLLIYFKPKILLGLTATPERMDGLDIKEYFDHTIASEIRLPEAIDRGLLVPFHYFGITDSVDLKSIKFERGRYDVTELNALFVNNQTRAITIIDAVNRYVTKIDDVIGLGFCVSKDHARFMAQMFNDAGIVSYALTDESSKNERSDVGRRLENGEIKLIFSVDLYNEGVDIPKVNTVLFLRPTESMTVFLQQLGRGLRLSPGKEVLTVLDFIGQANQKYSFENKFRSITEIGYKSIKSQVETQFTSLPKGCYIELERVARDHILQNINDAIINKKNIIQRIRSFYEDNNQSISMSSFVKFNNLELGDIYSKGTFSNLCREAGINIDGYNPTKERTYCDVFFKISHIDSRRWIDNLRFLLANDILSLDNSQKRFLLMLYYNFNIGYRNESQFASEIDFLNAIKSDSAFYRELVELLNIRYNEIKFVDEPVDLGFDNALDLHCTYSRDEVLTGLGVNTLQYRKELREGALYVANKDIDIFFINIIKSEKDFSPTTMYEDYVISDLLFHWQSQNKTSVTSSVGLRYLNERKQGGKVLLFVREIKKRNGLAEPYYYLGKANYENHYGDRPISFVWRLEKPIAPHILEKIKKNEN